MPTILIKKSDTASAVPGTANLTNLAGGAEVAVNTADRRMFTMNSSSAVVELGTNPSSLTCADGSFTLLKAASASITNLTATSLVLSNLSIASANITTLTSSSATITNLLGTTLTISGNSFLATSSGNVGIGTSSPTDRLHIVSAASTYIRTQNTGASIDAYYGVSGVGAWTGTGTNHPYLFYTNNAERMRLDISGNLGLGVTPSAWSGYKALQMAGGGSFVSVGNAGEIWSNAFYDGTVNKYIANGFATRYHANNNGAHAWYNAPSGTAGNNITFTQTMTLNASGELLVGTTTPGSWATSGRGLIEINGASNGALIGFKTANTAAGYLFMTSGYDFYFWNNQNAPLIFGTNNTERARITSNGDFLVGKSSAGSAATAGCEFGTYGAILTRVSGDPLTVNRQTNDGTIVSIRQDNVEEGSISVSGNTVSYNAFAGSHWSQLQDGSKPDILRGTVMESINELCVWPGEQNERLPKSKISDTAGSKKVYGVFMAWDNDWTETNDMYVTAVGAFICRVNGSVTVQEGDLLESNGDGTARVQADDIIRSSTIGKVTSTVKTHQYDDGSYCVPTVLYCG